MARNNIMAFFGHQIDDPDVLEYCKERNKENPSSGIRFKIKMLLGIFVIILAPRRLKKVMTEYLSSFSLMEEVKPHTKSPKDLFTYLTNNFSKHDVAFKNHGPCSLGSTIKCSLLKAALEGAKSKMFIQFSNKLKDLIFRRKSKS
jgi:hypothetical protein